MGNKKKTKKPKSSRVLPKHLMIYIGFIIAGLLVAGGLYVEGHTKPTAEQNPYAEILFGGDMMFDRTIRTTIEQKGGDFVFSCIDDIFRSNDLVVANLEGPITDDPSVSRNSQMGDGNNFTFTFPPSTAALLYKHNVRLVNLGNNHIFNFRLSGVLQTEKYLDEAGVGHFGDPDKIEADRVARIEIKGIPFSFVNWSDWTSDNTDITAHQVKAEHDAGRMVVVYTHWGEEYLLATDREKRLAHNLVDEGADIVIGSHPHIVQEHELYKGKNIYYSLGNLIFDQYFDEAVMHGLMLEVEFSHAGVENVKEVPVVLQHDRRTCPTPLLSEASLGAVATYANFLFSAFKGN